MAGHVFVSYERTDEKYVDKLTAALRKRRIEYWVDTHIDYGARWTQVIRQHVDTCAVFVVLMTPEAEASAWVGREIDQAEMMKRPITPLLLRGERFFRLSDLQFEDVRSRRLPAERWFERVRALSRRPVLADPVIGAVAERARRAAIRPSRTGPALARAANVTIVPHGIMKMPDGLPRGKAEVVVTRLMIVNSATGTRKVLPFAQVRENTLLTRKDEINMWGEAGWFTIAGSPEEIKALREGLAKTHPTAYLPPTD